MSSNSPISAPLTKTVNVSLDQYQRQIHLDFHTSKYIEDVGRDFDASAFAKRLKAAHVNMINVFSKCHHGMSYYPTKVGTQHPALNGRDMFGEMVTALKKEGIRTCAYTTIVWEEHIAWQHPEWRQMKKDGTFADLETSADGVTVQPAGWKFNNFMHPGYQDHIEAHLHEVMEYDIDGFWIDIVFLHPQGGWSPEFVKLRKKWNLMEDNAKNQVILESKAQEAFAEKMTGIIHSVKPGISVFYNTPNNRYTDGSAGIMGKSDYQTHIEIESLPSGFWGYYHFPRMARHLAHKGKDWNSMTGKFQKMWGDFGGIKPQPALEFECFRTQALGGANNVGDQLHPRGVLDEETYKLIGAVFQQIEEAEPFYKGSTSIPEIGVLCPNYMGLDEHETGKSEEGVVLMLEELHYDCAILDDEANLDAFKLLILPDSSVITPKMAKKLKAYQGKLIISYKGGHSETGEFQLADLPLSFEGEVELYPTYWQTNTDAGFDATGERVFYQQGLQVQGGDNAETWVHRVLPYFKRSDLQYCSHFQTPPKQRDDRYPALLGNQDFAYFSDPIFHEYRQSGNIFVKNIVRQTIERLLGKPMVGEGLSSSILSVPRRQGNDLLITLLHYVPVRKALDIDVIENRSSFAGEVLKFNRDVDAVYDVSSGTTLKAVDGGFALDSGQGRKLLKVEGYFA